MSTPVTLDMLLRVHAAIERALEDDRAQRVTLPRDTYMGLLRAGGELQTALAPMTRVPVEVAGAPA